MEKGVIRIKMRWFAARFFRFSIATVVYAPVCSKRGLTSNSQASAPQNSEETRSVQYVLNHIIGLLSLAKRKKRSTFWIVMLLFEVGPVNVKVRCRLCGLSWKTSILNSAPLIQIARSLEFWLEFGERNRIPHSVKNYKDANQNHWLEDKHLVPLFQHLHHLSCCWRFCHGAVMCGFALHSRRIKDSTESCAWRIAAPDRSYTVPYPGRISNVRYFVK